MSTIQNPAVHHSKKWLLIGIAAAVVLLLAFLGTKRSSENALQGALRVQNTTSQTSGSAVVVLDVTRSDAVSSGTVKAGAIDVPVLAVNFRAMNGPARLNSLTFTRTSTATVTDTKSVFTLKNGDGSALINYKKSFDPSNPNKLNFSALNVNIKQNEIRTIKVYGDLGDIGATANYDFYLNIATKEEVGATNTSTLPKNVKNPQVVVNDGDGVTNIRDPFDGPNKTGSVKITVEPAPAAGLIQISNPANPVPSLYVSPGWSNVLAARFHVLAATENFGIQKMTIKIAYPTANRDIKKLTLSYPTDLNNPSNFNGTASTYERRPGTSDTYDFILDNNFLVPGDSPAYVVFEVYVDLYSGSYHNDVIQLIFDGSPTSTFKAVGQTSTVVKTHEDVDSITSPTKVTVW